VANLESDAVYEKFQFVVRKNPYELRYSDLNVWAVKPNQMVSDILARTLLETGVFEGVVRNLGEQRPDYMLNGDLNAIEIYDSDDIWYAHLSISLSLTRFSDGAQLWQMSYDQRKLLAERSHAQAARAISELLAAAVRQAFVELSELGLDPQEDTRRRVEERMNAEDAEDEDEPPPVVPEKGADPHEPIYVPEPTPE
jgi:ABC-type uncharacterized transport system auxiliary subunit